MGEDSHKRKSGPGGDRGNFKKSKGGGGNRWQTPNQKARQAAQIESGTKLGVGDSGIWVTYARGQRPRAVREFIDLCEEYGQLMYGIKPFHSDDVEDEDGGPADIEASIEKELNDLQEKKKRPQDRTFSSVNTGIECVFFVKTRKPVDAAELTRRMCNDARSGDVPAGRRCKYINRLVPVMDVDKATEGGMERVGREILGREFELKKEDEEVKAEEEKKSEEEGCTYAIRHNIRHNKEMGRQQVIDKVAGLVDQQRHKVNLGKPDKVILVEVYQMLCGMSVVDGKEWEALKRYNLNEMYWMAREEKHGEKQEERWGNGDEKEEAKPSKAEELTETTA